MSAVMADRFNGDRAVGSKAEAVVVVGQLSADLSEGLAVWGARASCRGVGPAGFFNRGANPDRRALCGCCPVAEACLWWAMAVEEDSGYRFGVWGGTTPAVRARIATVTGPGYARRRLRSSLAELRQQTSGNAARGGRR